MAFTSQASPVSPTVYPNWIYEVYSSKSCFTSALYPRPEGRGYKAHLINYSEQNEITGFTKVDNQEIPDAVPRIIDFTNVGNPMNFRRSDGTEEQRQGILSSLLEHIHFIDNSPGNVGHP